MCNAQQLIAAVQSCNPDVLRSVIAQLKATAAPGHNPVNDRLSVPLNLTALHVAAKAYSAHRGTPRLAKAFDAMVAVLLEAGAEPRAEMGGVLKEQKLYLNLEPGKVEVCKHWVGAQTVAEVCEGRLPPSLATWFERNVTDPADSGQTDEQDDLSCQPSKRAKRRLGPRQGQGIGLHIAKEDKSKRKPRSAPDKNRRYWYGKSCPSEAAALAG